MSAVSALIVRAPGTNCDVETAVAWKRAGAIARTVHVNELLRGPGILDHVDILTVAGGFCYGDDISGGKILGTELRMFLADGLSAFVERGGFVLGICNGFQVLVKAGLLPGGAFGSDSVTIANNTSGHYEDRWVHLKVCESNCRVFAAEHVMAMPVAHAEGRVVCRDEATLQALRENGHVVFEYVDERGRHGDFPVNPNGSVGAIAGLTDTTGRIVGLMPHPERNMDETHAPCWTRAESRGEPDGMRFFRHVVAGVR